MSSNECTRREFLNCSARLGGCTVIAARWAGRPGTAAPGKPHISCNSYPWTMFYLRDGRDFNASLDEGLGEVAKSGLAGFEPAINAPGDIDRLGPLLKKHGLQMRSLYVNSTLHKPDAVEKSIADILAIAEKAKGAGTRIVVTNPSPIQWGGPANKDDAQLKIQAEAMNRLGERLKSRGMTLAYHNHDIELRNAAREFHHMMVGTDPDKVALCLDAHWIYRGSGNSSVALFDVLRLYGSRIREIHLRQSIDGTWSEFLGDGDIDYQALAKYLASIRIKPHLVLEQAPENGTPKTMDAVESHRRSLEYVSRVFKAFAD